MMGGISKYRRLPRNVFALSLVAFLNDTSSEIIYPLLPAFLYLTLGGASPALLGIIEGFAESVAALLKLFSGYLSDRFRMRKLPVFLGYLLASLSRPFLFFANTWTQILAIRVTDRIGKGIRGAPRDAMLAASVEPDRRGLVFGFNRAADHMGAVVGPITASMLLYFFAAAPDKPSNDEYRTVFLFAAIPVILGLLAVVFLVKESKAVSPETALVRPNLSWKMFDGNFKRYILIVGLFTLSNSSDAFLLLKATDAGVSVALIPILWMTLHFSKVVFSLIGGELSDKVGRKPLIISGWLVYAVVYFGFGQADAEWQLWSLFIAYGLFFGLTEGAEKALVADLVEEEKRGTAFGLYNLAYSIGLFPASLLFGLIWYEFGDATAFTTGAALALVAAVAMSSVRIQRDDSTG